VNISFSMTTKQVREKAKWETRRLGWDKLKVGQHLTAVVKAQGLKKGEHVEKICEIVVTYKRREPLNAIGTGGCFLEGFPNLTPTQFVDMFCKANKCSPDTIVNVIGFNYD
jgi:hypothetical protein